MPTGTAGIILSFLRRARNMLLSPRNEWQVIKEEQTTYWNVMARYVAIIAAVPPVMAVVERLTFGRRIAGSLPLGYIFATNVLWYFVIIANIVITATVISAIITPRASSWAGLRGLQLAGYSYTPLFLVGILIIIPRLNWFIYPAIVYSLCLLYLGIRSVTGAGQGRAAWYAMASFLAAGVILGILNLLEYRAESAVF